MRAWGKGIVFLNGFTLGRYFSAGPLHSLYIPAPLLQQGTNEVSVKQQFWSSIKLCLEIKFCVEAFLSNLYLAWYFSTLTNYITEQDIQFSTHAVFIKVTLINWSEVILTE